MPGKFVLLCVVGALAASIQAAETGGVVFEAIDDPLAEEPDFLPVEDAFVFSSRLDVGDDGTERIVVYWDMPPGFYLYRHGFAADADPGLTLGEPSVPPGETRIDEFFGESEVYFGSVEIVWPVTRRSVATATVRFGYQGCAERGLCYPPDERAGTFQFGAVPTVPGRLQAGIVLGGILVLLAASWAVRSMRARRDVR